MWPPASAKSTVAPERFRDGWFAALLGLPALPDEGESVCVRGQTLTMRGGILRLQSAVSDSQAQTAAVFGYKWAQRESFEKGVVAYLRDWLKDKYGDVAAAPWLFERGGAPLLLDAGCGAGASALALFEPVIGRLRYLGVDVSPAVEIAKARFAERGFPGVFMQADLARLPLPDEALDLVFAEGVLHHTDDTRAALAALVRLLRPGGRILFYVYRRKGPLREFTDDYIRGRLQAMTPEEGWRAMMPLTRLGRALGELGVEIEVPEPIELLGIPAGRIELHRLFYWHFVKAFYRPEMTLEEMNHVNFDWYAPRNAHRHAPEEVRGWCRELDLVVERERIEEAGITVIARKR